METENLLKIIATRLESGENPTEKSLLFEINKKMLKLKEYERKEAEKELIWRKEDEK